MTPPTALRERPGRSAPPAGRPPPPQRLRPPRGRGARSRSRTSTCSRRAASSSPASRRSCGCALDQHRADRRRGLHTGTFDLRLPGLAARRASTRSSQRNGELCERAPRRPRAGPQRGARRHRRVGQPARGQPAGRALRRRASASGTARRPASTAPPTRCGTATSSACRAPAAALAVVGDDPSCKSSTLPSASEALLAEPAHAGLLSRQRAGGARPRPARRSRARARRASGAG